MRLTILLFNEKLIGIMSGLETTEERMSATIKNQENSTLTMEIVIDKDNFQKALNKAYQKNKNCYSVQGFRKGKAPRKIIEAHYGKGIFMEDAIEEAFPQAYADAIAELNVNPASRPVIEDITEVGEDGATLIVQTAVKPEVKLGEYKGAVIKGLEPLIGEDKIQKEIDKLLDQNARLVSVEDKAAEDGDTVNIDFKGFIGDEAFEGGEAQDHLLELGSHSFIDGFEDQLVGAKAGEERDVVVTFPEDYGAENLAGKEATFKCKVNEVLKKEVPEFDDDFVMDVSEFDTVDEFKDDLIGRLKEQEKEALRRDAERKAITFAMDNAEVAISDLMVNEEADDQLRQLSQSMQQQGISLDQYLQITGTDPNEFYENMKEDARRNLEMEAVLEAIVTAEELEASEEEVEEEIKKQAEMMDMEVEDFRHQYLTAAALDYLNVLIKRQKAVDLLIDSAVTEATEEE